MNLSLLRRQDETEWHIEPRGGMRVPGVIYATEQLVRDMDEKVFEQVTNVARLPGIVRASFAMPDAHWGYGFPIGGVAAFDPDRGGVVSAGGVGFDISCGVRLLTTGLTSDAIESVKTRLADALASGIPAGVGSIGSISLDDVAMEAMLEGGGLWAVGAGYGHPGDLERTEEHGRMPGAKPEQVSTRAKDRQREEMGTLGSGNHYLEVQRVSAVFDAVAASAFGLHEHDAVISLHCGSRGLGHQVGSEFLREMVASAPSLGLTVPDRELAAAPIRSPLGEAYLGAMRAAINCAFANRQILTHLVRRVFARVLPAADLAVVYDVSHNTCREEWHDVDGAPRRLFVHRKGATRAWGPGASDLPPEFAHTGQPVFVGGTMGTASWVLVGTTESEARAFGSSCHGAGRAMSRHHALRRWRGAAIVAELAARGIELRSPSLRGIAEEAPGAYKDVDAVADAASAAGLSRKVARLEPVIGIKG
ncbi:MAG: RtcB family protein [Vicinamibacterales bacterium]